MAQAMSASDKIWTAALIVIGDEILSGRTHDKNIAQVASWLQVQGIRLAEVRVVPDVLDRIGEAVNALRTAHDYLFTTRSEEHTSELQSLMRISYAVFCWKKKKRIYQTQI